MEWHKLLIKERVSNNCDLITPFYKLTNFNSYDFMEDYNNIISSAFFRRLQDKTQVFPLDKSDFVRTRLTHSLEVSSIASKLGAMVMDSYYLCDEMNSLCKDDVIMVLSCAGLLHDIGNPPFGHFGEYVIGNWFKENLNSIYFNNIKITEFLNKHMLEDLYNFEGNSQALRILSKTKYKSQINISKTIVNVLIKYPVSSIEFNLNDKDIKKHKPGYYYAEKDTFFNIIKSTGTIHNGIAVRHPLTFLLEAADDIAYITADLEDAYKKSLFKIKELKDFLLNTINKKNDNYSYELFLELDGVQTSSDFRKWVLLTQMYLINSACFSFIHNYNDIIKGNYIHDLFYKTYHQKTVTSLKSAMKYFVYTNKDIVLLELSCENILYFLLDKFTKAIIYFDENDYENITSSSDMKYIQILSSSFKEDYINIKNELVKKDVQNIEQELLYHRLLIVVDFISSMTDSYAKDLYHKLSGLNV